MTVSVRIEISPSVLRWARVSARLDISQAAQRIEVSAEQLTSWEAGEKPPTLIQLRRIADSYSRPLATFFMAEPPAQDDGFEVPDFRRPALHGQESKALSRAILDAKERRDAIDSLVDEGFEPPFAHQHFVLDRNQSPESTGAELRTFVGLDRLVPGRSSKPEDMLRTLIKNVENHGILVMQVQRIDWNEMRGFSLPGTHTSIICLNGADSPRGKVFTLLHELVHVGLRHGALCDLGRVSESAEERFCDATAAAALLPSKTFALLAQELQPISYENLRCLADQFGPAVSAESALLRMVDLGITPWNTYHDMRRLFQEAYQNFRLEQKTEGSEGNKPIYYPMKIRDLGKPFLWSVTKAHEDGLLSSRDVSQLLGMDYSNINKLVEMASLDGAY